PVPLVLIVFLELQSQLWYQRRLMMKFFIKMWMESQSLMSLWRFPNVDLITLAPVVPAEVKNLCSMNKTAIIRAHRARAWAKYEKWYGSLSAELRPLACALREDHTETKHYWSNSERRKMTQLRFICSKCGKTRPIHLFVPAAAWTPCGSRVGIHVKDAHAKIMSAAQLAKIKDAKEKAKERSRAKTRAQPGRFTGRFNISWNNMSPEATEKYRVRQRECNKLHGKRNKAKYHAKLAAKR
ncbi:unnamed protein product, partial [Prorocentrum cordatum]